MPNGVTGPNFSWRGSGSTSQIRCASLFIILIVTTTWREEDPIQPFDLKFMTTIIDVGLNHTVKVPRCIERGTLIANRVHGHLIQSQPTTCKVHNNLLYKLYCVSPVRQLWVLQKEVRSHGLNGNELLNNLSQDYWNVSTAWLSKAFEKRRFSNPYSSTNVISKEEKNMAEVLWCQTHIAPSENQKGLSSMKYGKVSD